MSKQQFEDFLIRHMSLTQTMMNGSGLSARDYTASQLSLSTEEEVVLDDLAASLIMAALQMYTRRMRMGEVNRMEGLMIGMHEIFQLGLVLGADIEKNYERKE